MNMISKLCFTFGLLVILGQSVIAKEPEIKKLQNGFYGQVVITAGSWDKFVYYADTKAKACFVTIRDSVAEFDCSKLKNRAGWETIITWIK